ncbi:PspC domain-containing protein [Cellulomonas gilvus]|uniref:PspC domain protein n=1 Tax=Cellulomonas gilvus (strain ATCC 13127 / NRRL B-14078) TaxID=593907 RepID=F8A011_CELGA|nr:PspC domain-containing protein [Cellulomonas gilvus]AEI11430.1 PspC domain protein [Cellulomonas gilvus ATCC 13127]
MDQHVPPTPDEQRPDPAAAGPTPAQDQPAGTPDSTPDSTTSAVPPGTEVPPQGPAAPGPGDQPGSAPGGPGGGQGGGLFGAVRRLGVQRSDDRWIGGVCAGVAERWGVDPIVVRGLLAATLLLGGVGAVAYGIAWALLPERRDGRIHLEEMVAGRFDVAIVGAALVAVLGAARGGDLWWSFWGPGPGWAQDVANGFSGVLWLGFVVAVVIGIASAASRSGRTSSGAPRPTSPYPAPPHAGSGPAPARPGTPYATTPSTPAPYSPTPYAPTPYARTAYPPTSYAPPQPAAHQPGSYAATSPYRSSPYVSAPVGAGTPSPAGPYGPAAAAGHPAPRPQAGPPPRPPKPRRRGPGATSVGVVVALALLTLAALLATSRTGAFDGPVLLTTLGVTAVLAGLGIVVAGLRGRSSGSLGFLAIVSLLVALPAGAVARPGWVWEHDGATRFSDSAVVVTTRADAADGVRVGAGDTTLDLTGVPLSDDLLTVPVSVGAGQLEIVVPRDAAVEATVRLGLGSVVWDIDDSYEQVDGLGVDRRTFSDEASSAGQPQIDLDLSVGVGKITIVREDA